MSFRALPLAALLLLTGAGSAEAATSTAIQLHATGLEATSIRSDGGRLIAAEPTGAGGVTVLDLTTGRREDVVVGEGCLFADLHVGRALFSCHSDTAGAYDSGLIVDVATGRRTALPAIDVAQASGSHDVSYTGLGRIWLQVTSADGRSLARGYVRPGGSAPTFLRVDDRRQLTDLDAAVLPRPLCRGLLRPIVVGDYPSNPGPGPLDVVGRAAVATTLVRAGAGSGPARTVLQRCGQPEQVLERCGDPGPTTCPPADLDDRYVGWDRLTRQGFRGYVRRIEGGRVLRLSPAGIGGVTFAGHRVCAVRESRVLCSAPLAPLLPPVRRR